MAENWVDIAQKLAESARARVAADRKRLQEIMKDRQRTQTPKSTFPR
jgi:hypothetical protein